jgi:hypothetical protein
MRLYLRHSSRWHKLVRDLQRDNGYKIPNTDITVKWVQGNERLMVYKNIPGQQRTDIMQLNLSGTTWCCGVSQLGNFYEHSTRFNQELTDEIKQEILKIILSYAHNMYNKGVVQAWFYKTPRKDDYEHPNILQLFTKNKFKKIGRASYNPNSGNTIQGYQLTISRKPRNGNS